MKKLLVLASLFSMAFITSCNKNNDEIEENSASKKTHVKSEFCKNEDNAIFKIYLSVVDKDESTIRAGIKYELDLLSRMNAQFIKDENNKDKVLYLKSEPSVVSSDGSVQEMLISIHISDNPSDPVPETTRTIYTGSEAGAKAEHEHVYWQNVGQYDPCAPYAIFQWDGIWYLEDCC